MVVAPKTALNNNYVQMCSRGFQCTRFTSIGGFLNTNVDGKTLKVLDLQERKLILFELVERYEQKDLYDLFESGIDFIADNYDYKEMHGGYPNDFS